jgi:hypothetical protein
MGSNALGRWEDDVFGLDFYTLMEDLLLSG